MRISALSIPLLIAFALPAGLQTQSAMPMMTSVEPASGKAGDVLNVQGTNLGQDHVAALFLTAGEADIKAQIIEQTDTSIKFRIPPEAKAGRFALMVLTKGKDPRLLEEPVKITVEPMTTSSALADGSVERLERYV
jgi:hypothetical protein